MILSIDVGNTNTVAALMNNNSILKEYRYNTDKTKKAIYQKENIKKLIGKENISGIIISSVVPEINDYMQEACITLTGISPIFISSHLETGLTIKYDNPDKLGNDLIAAAVGAVNQYGNPVIIIDIGTATTLSVINENNEYLGGMIAPGPYTSMKALAALTSQLNEIELTATDKIIGTNTADCIRIGTLTAQSAMLDGMLDKIINSLKIPNVKIIATGGFAKKITAMCTHNIICDDNLIFKGLYELYKLNCKNPK